MAQVTVTLDFHGRQVPFRFPDSVYMQQHLTSVLSGKEYVLPPLPIKLHTIVDIGANVGASGIWLLSVAPDARLVCFEPSRENFECLQHNLKSFSKAELLQCGLFNEEREASLFLGADLCMQHSIIASIETSPRTEPITLKRASAEFDRLHLKEISILKIDTEGCEVAILEDLGDERLAHVDWIFLEWHSEEDRRRIDELLGGQFLLAQTMAHRPHRGTAGYLARSLADKIPAVKALRIPSIG